MFFRIVVITACCGLLLAPVWVANDGVDRLFASQGGPPSAIALSVIGDDVLARLGGVKAEIHADICSRGEKRACLAGLCLPVTQSCARK